MTDKKLYELCKKFGKETLEARRKFAGLLPEVYKRRLYEKKGFSSIFEFAAKLAGMSKDQVSLVLNLERKFADKPSLKSALIFGDISMNKLARVSSIATSENEEELCEKIKVLSNRATETFVRDIKIAVDSTFSDGNNHTGLSDFENKNGFQKPLFGHGSLHVQTMEMVKLKLDADIEKELFEMQEKGIDINEFLRNALKKRKEEIEEKKAEIAEEIAKEQNISSTEIGIENGRVVEYKIKASSSRYVPVKVRKIVTEEHGTKCSYPGCKNQAKILHHTQRFALTRSHDPRFIAPLCEAHHEIAHKIDLRFTEKTIAN